ncbi:hypothetical protein AgCh_009793 [Apium graveolens]
MAHSVVNGTKRPRIANLSSPASVHHKKLNMSIMKSLIIALRRGRKIGGNGILGGGGTSQQELLQTLMELKRKVEGIFFASPGVLPFSKKLEDERRQTYLKHHNLYSYNGSEDSEERLSYFDQFSLFYGYRDLTYCRFFASTLRGGAYKWFCRLPPRSIDTWNNFKKDFLSKFKVNQTHEVRTVFLETITQRSGETLENYLTSFKESVTKVRSVLETEVPVHLRRGLDHYDCERNICKLMEHKPTILVKDFELASHFITETEAMWVLVIMGDPAARMKALMDFSQPKINDIQSCIVRTTITANTFEIKPGIIQWVHNSIQFGGSPTEDPNMHIRDFIEICDTFKFNGVSEDAVKLRLTAAIRNAITQFAQQSEESLYEVWERYKEMLKKCPYHGIPNWMIINYFYNGLGAQSRPMLNAASGGALWAKSYKEAYDLIELMAVNEYQYPTQRLPQGKVAGVLQVDTTTTITAQLKELSIKIDSLANYGVNQITSVCELCARSHATEQCAISSESAQFVSNFQRSQQPVPDTYHPDNWNHPNFRWSNNQNAMQLPFRQFGNEQFNLHGFQQQFAPRQQLQLKQQTHGCAGTLPSDTEANPGDREVKEQVHLHPCQNEIMAEEKVQKEEEVEPRKTTVEHTPPEGNTGEKQIHPPPHFPKRLQKLDKQFAKFLEVFKKLHINIPFAEALEQMPSYARFMKGILSRKVKLDDLETVALMEECSAILQQKLPPKLKDPGSFTIPCTIGNLSFDKCLSDRSIAYPRGIVEDVLVKVDKLIFPADFIILDFEEDKKIPIILGRPFLATGRTMINVQKRELTMKVHD